MDSARAGGLNRFEEVQMLRGRGRATAVVVAAFVGALVPSPARAATLVADYRFEGSHTSSVGTAPALSDIGPGTNTFATETVYGASRSVLTFPEGNGLVLSPTTDVVPNDQYTIAIVVRFDDVSGYNRYADFKNGQDDSGWYDFNGALSFYPNVTGTERPIGNDEYVQVVLTRDVAHNVSGYVNGALQFSFVDDVEMNAVIDSNQVLRFFIDDVLVAEEHSAGAVARIRLWDAPLTADEVAALDDNPPAPQKVETEVSIRYNGEFFSGYVRAEESTQDPARASSQAAEEVDCESVRKVVLKQPRPGKDRVVGRDFSNYLGYWKIREEEIRGAYYAVAKRKIVTAADGTEFICARDRSPLKKPPQH